MNEKSVRYINVNDIYDHAISILKKDDYLYENICVQSKIPILDRKCNLCISPKEPRIECLSRIIRRSLELFSDKKVKDNQVTIEHNIKKVTPLKKDLSNPNFESYLIKDKLISEIKSNKSSDIYHSPNDNTVKKVSKCKIHSSKEYDIYLLVEETTSRIIEEKKLQLRALDELKVIIKVSENVTYSYTIQYYLGTIYESRNVFNICEELMNLITKDNMNDRIIHFCEISINDVHGTTQYDYLGKERNIISSESLNTVEEKVRVAFSQLFGIIDLSSLYLVTSVESDDIKTETISTNNILDIKENMLNNYLVTPKIDGRQVIIFLDINNGVDLSRMIMGDYMYNISISNISKEKDITAKIYGEYYRHKEVNLFFPFYISRFYENNKEVRFDNRNDSFTYLENLLSSDKDYNSKQSRNILIKMKQFLGPFNNKSEFFLSIYNVMSFDTEYETDGIIIACNDITNKPIIDYKYKSDFTVDVLCVVDLKFPLVFVSRKTNEVVEWSKYNYGRTIDDVDMCIKIKVYNQEISESNLLDIVYLKNDINKNVSERKWLYIVTDNILIYYKDKIVVPFLFIGEYSFKLKTIIRPRDDKTNRLYRYRYRGNHSRVVNEAKILHESNKIISYEGFKKLSQDPDDKQFYLLAAIPVDDEEDNKDVTYPEYILNSNKTTYYKAREDTDRNLRDYSRIVNNIFKTMCTNNNKLAMIAREFITNAMEIDAGRLGEMEKHILSHTTKLIATEINQQNINEGKKRYLAKKDSMSGRSDRAGSIFDLIYIKVRLSDGKFVEKIWNKERNFRAKYVGIHFSIHYSWVGEWKRQIVDSLARLTVPGAKINITYLDGKKLLNTFSLLGTDSIKFNVQNNYYYFKLKTINNPYNPDDKLYLLVFESGEIDKQEEYIVYPLDMINWFESSGYFILRDSAYIMDMLLGKSFLTELKNLMSQVNSKSAFNLYRSLLDKDFDLVSILETKTEDNNLTYDSLMDHIIVHTYERIERN